jgi:hypothetical protein
MRVRHPTRPQKRVRMGTREADEGKNGRQQVPRCARNDRKKGKCKCKGRAWWLALLHLVR